MWARTAIGCTALGLYGWRVADPKASYAAFYDASDWVTGWVLTDEGFSGWMRNLAGLVLVDQADGFLLGMAAMALLSAVVWPVRACWRTVRRRTASAFRRPPPPDPSESHKARF